MTKKKVLIVDFWVKCPKMGYLFNTLKNLDFDIYILKPSETPVWFGEFIENDHICDTDLHNPTRSLADLSVFCEKNNIKFDAIVTFEDHLVVIASILAQFFNCIHTPLNCMIGSSVNKLLFRNKYNDFDNPNFIKSPISLYIPGNGEKLVINSSKVIKPIFGSDGQGVMKIDPDYDFQQISHYLAESCPEKIPEFKKFNRVFLLEDYIGGGIFSVDGIVQGNKIHFAGINQVGSCPEPYFTQISNTIPANITKDQEEFIYSNISAFLNYIEYDNTPFHVEIKYNDNKIYIIEIGCRAPGGQILKGYEKAFGINFIEQVLNLYSGISVNFEKKFNKHVFQKGVYIFDQCTIDHLEVKQPIEEADEFVQIVKPGDVNKSNKPDCPIYYYSVSDTNIDIIKSKSKKIEESVVIHKI